MSEQTAPSFSRGCFGDLVKVLQRALAQHGFYTSAVDADFGGGTRNAVQRYHEAYGGSAAMAEGRVDAAAWQGIVGSQWPDLFERCLQVVARFEGHGYTYVAGNFDGALLTWGIIGFTLGNGELQRLLRDILLRDPALMAASFGPLLPELQQVLAYPYGSTVLKDWANQISLPPKKAAVRLDWRNAFRALGEAPLTQALQREAAWQKYFVPAMQTAQRLGLAGDLGMLLAFDIHVQNGSVKSAVEKAFLKDCPLAASISQRERRQHLATLVAASARKEYQQDVLRRKSTIAQGHGEVHQVPYQLAAWALAID